MMEPMIWSALIEAPLAPLGEPIGEPGEVEELVMRALEDQGISDAAVGGAWGERLAVRFSIEAQSLEEAVSRGVEALRLVADKAGVPIGEPDLSEIVPMASLSEYLLA